MRSAPLVPGVNNPIKVFADDRIVRTISTIAASTVRLFSILALGDMPRR